MSDVSLGVLIALAAGLVNGSFAAPTKYTTRWKWENIWAVWAVVALFITPWLLAFLTIPDLPGFYRNTSAGFILMLAAFGFGVGLAQVFFGLALAAVGLSIGFAVTIGLSTALGSLVPLVLLHPAEVRTPQGATVIAGVALILIGTGCCGLASSRKSRDAGLGTPAAAGPRSGQRFSAGLLLCILAGALSPLMNIALALGSPIMSRAAKLHISPTAATYGARTGACGSLCLPALAGIGCSACSWVSCGPAVWLFTEPLPREWLRWDLCWDGRFSCQRSSSAPTYGDLPPVNGRARGRRPSL